MNNSLYKISPLIILFAVVMCFSCTKQEKHDDPPNSADSANTEMLIKFMEPATPDLVNELEETARLFSLLDAGLEDKDWATVSGIRSLLANKFRLTGNYFEGLRFYRRAMNAPGEYLSDSIMSVIYHGMASIHYEIFLHNPLSVNSLDSVAVLGRHAYDYATSCRDTNLISDALNILGAVENQQGHYEEAAKLLQKALNYKQHLKMNSPAVEINLAYALTKMGEYDKALQIAESTYMDALTNKSDVFAGTALELIIQIKIKLGHKNEAQSLAADLRQFKKENEVLLKNQLMKQLLLNFRLKKEKDYISGLYKEQYYMVRLSRILTGAMLLLIISMLIVIRMFRQEKKIRAGERQFHLMQKHADELKLQNTKLELKTKEAEAKLLKSDLEIKDQKLASKLMALSHLNEFLLHLKNKLNDPKQFGAKAKLADRQISEIHNEISRLLNNNIWQEFELVYASGNSNFIQELSRVHPNLSINEKRLSYFILMNLTTKEIAQVLQKSYRSVEMARHRLRQKIGLDKNTSLQTYLSQFTIENTPSNKS